MQIDSTQLTGFAQAIFEKLGAAEEKARETASTSCSQTLRVMTLMASE